MVDKEQHIMKMTTFENKSQLDQKELNITTIKSAWKKKLREGFMRYDPEESSLKIIEPYIVRYVPGRLKYLKDTAPVPFDSIDISHDPEDVFCSAREQIMMDQKISEVSLGNLTWDLLVNSNPIETYHSMLIPQGIAGNQIIRPHHLTDLIEFVEANGNSAIAFNSFGAGASQNHFHVHLFLSDWSVEKITNLPINNSLFPLTDTENVNRYIDSLVMNNTAHNVVMTKDGIVITPRRNEHINGIRYGVDAISGRLLTTSPDQFDALSRDGIDKIMDNITYSTEIQI